MANNDRQSLYLAFGIYGAAGVQLAVSVIAGLFGGNYLDKQLGTLPWLTLVGLILGTVGGFWNLIRIMEWHRKRRGDES